MISRWPTNDPNGYYPSVSQGVEPTVTAALKDIAETLYSEEEFKGLCLTFSFTLLSGAEVELLPGGSEREVWLHAS